MRNSLERPLFSCKVPAKTPVRTARNFTRACIYINVLPGVALQPRWQFESLSPVDSGSEKRHKHKEVARNPHPTHPTRGLNSLRPGLRVPLKYRKPRRLEGLRMQLPSKRVFSSSKRQFEKESQISKKRLETFCQPISFKGVFGTLPSCL